MGLFDKKYCDVCGAKIGFLGNRKLEDGSLCKECAGKLSPFFSDRRNSTVAEIKEQIAYREKNKQQLDDFLPSITFDGSKKVYIDPISERFIVTRLSNWRSGNPDLISFSQVRNVETDIRENKEEIFYKDSEGNEKSYNPRRYECDYEFNITIHVDSPWFDEIELELSDGNRPDSRFTDLYREYEQKTHELADILMRRDNRHRVFDGDGMMKQIRAEDEHPDSVPASQPSGGEWVCPSCGLKSSGAKFCDNCGALKPAPVEAAPAAAAQTSVNETWVCLSCVSEGQSKNSVRTADAQDQSRRRCAARPAATHRRIRQSRRSSVRSAANRCPENMKRKFPLRAVIIMSVFLVVSGLFGCDSSKKHTVDDIISLHTSYYGMESNPVYAFALRKYKENWLFSASCYVKSRENYYTSFSSFPIPTGEAEQFLEIIREEGEIKRLRKYRNPIRIFHIADAPSRSSGMTFTDGSSVEKETAFSDKALQYLYTLADKHYEAAENIEVVTVHVYRSCMDYSSSYSYTLEKNENVWYFSFDAVIDSSGAHTEVERQRIDEHDAKEILQIIKEQQLVAKVRLYETPPDDGISVLDETVYGISFGFLDGSSIEAPIDAGEELREAFYILSTVKINHS